MRSCPSEDTLGGLGVAIIEGPRFDELERHIEACPACRSALEKLVRRDPECGGFGATLLADRHGPPSIPGFVIEEELGRGSMGVVYLARQPRLARRVALKVIRGAGVDGVRVRDEWIREAQAGARVRDPRVVQIHDVGEADGCRYLILEFVPGGSLKDRLDGPLPAPASASIVEQIAGGVAAIHRAGVLHLDLKPSNILMDSGPGTPWESSSPKVADFGIARDTDDSGMVLATMRGPLGTPSYMAPEQVEPDRLAIGPASDVYALGAILYELLTGRPPFRSASLIETMDLIRHQDPVPPRRLNPSIPRDLETICTTCLSKDPKRRYPCANALAEDLRRWMEGRSITARPASIGERAWRWARRRPLIAALATALAATLILGVVGLVALWRRAEAQRRRAEDLHDVARANYQVASQSLREFGDFTYQMVLDPKTGWSLPPYLGRALEEARARQLELSRRNALELGGRQQLANIDLMLAGFYRNHRKREDEARRLLYESIDLWEACIAQGADLDDARTKQLQALDYLAALGRDITDEAELRRWDGISTQIYRRLCRDRNATGDLFGLSYRERQIADYLADAGRPDRARQFLEDKQRLLESLLETHGTSPDLLLARALNRTALGSADRVSLTSCVEPSAEADPGGRRRSMLVLALAELTARTHGLRVLGPVSWDQSQADRDDAAWAGRAVHFLADQAGPLALDEDAISAAAWQLRELITGMAAHHRAVGKHPEARRSARLFVALAAEFVRAFPGRAESYLLVCEAHLQIAKNASRTADRATVEWSLRRSLQAAQRALALDPKSDDAYRFVLDRMRRVAALESRGKAVAVESRGSK